MLALLTSFLLASGPLSYTITVDPSRLNQYDVTMRGISYDSPITLVMARHPEYDSRFWRYVTDLSATVNGAAATIVREDSARWRVTSSTRGPLQLHYRIVMPAPAPGNRASWRPFVSSKAALVGGIDSFIFPRGYESSISVQLDVPAEWRVATSLANGSRVGEYSARDIFTLVDSPILIGQMSIWTFAVDGVRHHIAYAPAPPSAPFDTVSFVALVQGLAREAAAIFGGMPYREFTFLFQDSAYAGLEHAASVTLGAPAAVLATNMMQNAPTFAHEFFHSWNLVALHPAGLGGVREGGPPQTTGLWLSEGATIYYANVILRRTGAITDPRIEWLAAKISNYFSNPGNTAIAPEIASRFTDAPPGAFGDYQPDLHLQGEMVATVLDLAIRDSSQWRHSLDDVMRSLYEQRTSAGFTSADVIRAVDKACTCHTSTFFARHVAGAEPLDFNAALHTLGLLVTLTTDTARADDQSIEPDMNSIWAYTPPTGGPMRLIVSDPDGAWGRAGLHTNDELVAWNGAAVPDLSVFRSLNGAVKAGSTVTVTTRRGGQERVTAVRVGAQLKVTPHIEQIANATSDQRAHYAAWMSVRK